MRMAEASAYVDVREFRVEEKRPVPGTAILEVHGDADLHSAPELRERLRMAVDDGATSLVVDFSDLTFIDSTTLGVLLGSMRRLRQTGGRMRLVVPGQDVRRIFELTLLDRVFPLDDSREEALDALSESAG